MWKLKWTRKILFIIKLRRMSVQQQKFSQKPMIRRKWKRKREKNENHFCDYNSVLLKNLCDPIGSAKQEMNNSPLGSKNMI